VASRRTFEDDLYLKLRQGDAVNSCIRGRVSRATFGSAERPHSMDFPLRPGEQVNICWHNEGRWFELTDDRRPIPLAKIPPCFGNGAIVYEPTAEGEAAVLENLRVEVLGDGTSVLRPEDPAKPATLIYRAGCPYILSDGQVSGQYETQKAGDVRLALSFDDGKNWTELWSSAEPSGRIDVGLLDQVSARYAYWLKLELAPGSAAAVKSLKVRTTFVVAPLSLPGKLARGKNRIRFVGGPTTVPVKTACRWTERHQSDLCVSLNSTSYYMNGDAAHRNLFVVPPRGQVPIKVTLQGRPLHGRVALEGLPEGWAPKPETQPVELAGRDPSARAEFLLQPMSASEGEIRGFEILVHEQDRLRRVPAQVLVADAPLVREAEKADTAAGSVQPVDLGELSGAGGMRFGGEGRLGFDFTAPGEGKYALWLRARWEPESSTGMRLALDGGRPRSLRATAMIGFTDWTNPGAAHTKMFAHFGEQYGHWSWYRIPDVQLTEGKHRLTLEAEAGAQFDALLLLPQNPAMDRAAMNLFQNWNYAPWDNPW
jgi:hypothetical protein